MSEDDRPLRVLHLTAGSDAGGVSRYIHDLATAMQKQGHEVAVAGERGAWHWLFEDSSIPWIDLPLKGGPWAFAKCVVRLRGYVRSHRVDVVHAHYRRGTLLGRALRLFKKTPILYTMHLSHIPLGWPRRPFNDFGDHTHVASEQTRRWLTEPGYLPPRMVTLIPHGIDSARFPVVDAAARAAARAELGLGEGELVAGYVGRLDDPKNVDWLLDFAAAAGPRLGNLRVVIAGQGPQEADLRARIAAMNLGGRVMLLGHREPLGVYQAIDALLLPSAREGFSLVCGEAMSVGIPVLRTRTAGTNEMLVEGVTGRSVDIDHDAFVAGAIEFLADRAALARMGEAAASHVRRHLTVERQVTDTIALYRFLLQKRQRR